MVQTLADGNRIVRESKAQIARDGKGRTRREQGVAMFGPLVGGFPVRQDEPRHIQISDPTEQDDDHARPAAPNGPQNTGASFQDCRAEPRWDQSGRGKASMSTTSKWRFPPHRQEQSSGRHGTVHLYSGRKIVSGSSSARACRRKPRQAVHGRRHRRRHQDDDDDSGGTDWQRAADQGRVRAMVLA